MAAQKNLQVLDSIRGAAALYVIFHHWLLQFASVPKWITKGVFGFGQEAVMLFFLLSGFVIGFSYLRSSDQTFRTYFLKRLRRIYFPFIVAVLLSISIYLIQDSLRENFSFFELFGNFFMLQDVAFLKPGTWVEPFLGNLPLWSLTYEWWFYMLFFVAYKFIFQSPYRFYIIAFFSVVAYSIYWMFPNQLSLILTYFSIWWSGIELADLYIHKKELNFSRLKPILLILASLSLVSFIPVLYAEEIRLGFYPFLIFRHFTFALLSVFTIWLVIKFKMDKYNHMIAPFAKIAPVSYGLYIFHFPLLVQFQGFTFVPDILDELLKIIILVTLVFIVEVKLQPMVNRLIR
jgi:peptidoglycan/LPS O-acetylase OafA/YrhL